MPSRPCASGFSGDNGNNKDSYGDSLSSAVLQALPPESELYPWPWGWIPSRTTRLHRMPHPTRLRAAVRTERDGLHATCRAVKGFREDRARAPRRQKATFHVQDQLGGSGLQITETLTRSGSNHLSLLLEQKPPLPAWDVR